MKGNLVYVKERFYLSAGHEDFLRSLIPPFGYNGFGEFLFYRTYSRIKDYETGENEDWADVIIRATNGTFSIRKDWYIKNRIYWDEKFWQAYAFRFALAMFKMEWLPPGRGLFAMGTDFVYERGSMALYNCSYTDITTSNMSDDIAWLMDCLMCGVGVGFGPIRDDNMELHIPRGSFDFVIPDTREGWCESVVLLLDAYLKKGRQKPRMIYDEVRGPGMPIKGFGGVSSGPAPLKLLHENIINEAERFKAKKEYDSVYFKTNVANHTGCGVVAGNVRRSAELCKGKVSDSTFMNLKDYRQFPERESFGWMSNNSVELETDEDFMQLGEIAKRVLRNGEPGYINRRNMPYGRIGKKMRGLRKDACVGFNPCGEIPLEHREVCNIAETLPTMCPSNEKWMEACEFATMYCSTVSLLPTHHQSTNRVVARNRRIGVSIIDYTGWKMKEGVHRVTQYMRDGYKRVRFINKWVNEEAGIPISIRVTTIKPGGTVPKLAGKTSGIGHPTFRETLRRVRVAKNAPVHKLVADAGVPYEADIFSMGTDVFEWPILQGPAKPATEVTLWEQAMNLITVQREWSDNSVSNTLYFRPMWPMVKAVQEGNKFLAVLSSYIGYIGAAQFLQSGDVELLIPEKYKIEIVKKPWYKEGEELHIHEYDAHHEENDVEPVLSAIAPLTKSVTVLPHSADGAYPQMPESGISREEYEDRLAVIKKIDWTCLKNSDGADERYCTTEACEMPK